ncbi:MAG TPA: hypothetical protein VFU72_01290 [Nitrolancea sp.]|nr:hypothetical protein [Nitrolancea sp.]
MLRSAFAETWQSRDPDIFAQQPQLAAELEQAEAPHVASRADISAGGRGDRGRYRPGSGTRAPHATAGGI